MVQEQRSRATYGERGIHPGMKYCYGEFESDGFVKMRQSSAESDIIRVPDAPNGIGKSFYERGSNIHLRDQRRSARAGRKEVT